MGMQRNMAYEITEDGILNISIDLKEEGKVSQSGKTKTVATTGGAQTIQHSNSPVGAFGLTVNAFVYPEDADQADEWREVAAEREAQFKGRKLVTVAAAKDEASE